MAASTPALEISGLTKVFDTKTLEPVPVLDGIDLTLERGEIFGFLGRNGAGKTTTVKILTGAIRDYEGECRVLGHAPASMEARQGVGLLPEVLDFQGWLTAVEIMELHGRLHGVPRERLSDSVPQLLTRCGLGQDAWNRRVGPFSKGMLQRLGIAVSLVGEPELVFLDEPTANLDPVGRRQVRDLLLDLEREGKTVFLNSHLLSDVERTCSRVAILEKGRIVQQGDILGMAHVQPYVHLRTTTVPPGLLEDLRAMSDDVAVLDGTIVVRVRTADDMDPIPSLVERHGARLRYLNLAQESLEDVFMRIVGAEGGGAA